MSGLQVLTIEQGLIQAAAGRRIELRKLNFGPQSTILVTSNTITIQFSIHNLSNPTQQEINTILGGEESDLLILTGDDGKLVEGGNIKILKEFKFDKGCSITFVFIGSNWVELSRTI